VREKAHRGSTGVHRRLLPARQSTRNPKRETQNAKLVRPLLRWFAAHARDLPWRRTLDPYAVWVSEIMLQQTQVKTVIPYYERWLRELPDAHALADAPPDQVLKLWEGLGYYTRARNLQRAAQQIVAEHGGEFPRDFEAVLALPGIGRYTAGAITSIAFNQPAPILDGNVIRVLTRLFAIRENPRDKAVNARLWELAEQLVQAASHSAFRVPHSAFLLSGRSSALNQSLMELGATVCTPRQPACGACPLRTNCAARAQELVGQLPNLGARAASTARRFAAFVIARNGRVLVRQRPAGAVNAHLWEFPNVELTDASPAPLDLLRNQLGVTARDATLLCTIKHSITRYRITVEAMLVEPASVCGAPASGPAVAASPASTRRIGDRRSAGQWVALADLDRLAFTSAHRKILRAFLAARSVSTL
jgi:A/G-specific adenine glycosylase